MMEQIVPGKRSLPEKKQSLKEMLDDCLLKRPTKADEKNPRIQLAPTWLRVCFGIRKHLVNTMRKMNLLEQLSKCRLPLEGLRLIKDYIPRFMVGLRFLTEPDVGVVLVLMRDFFINQPFIDQMINVLALSPGQREELVQFRQACDAIFG